MHANFRPSGGDEHVHALNIRHAAHVLCDKLDRYLLVQKTPPEKRDSLVDGSADDDAIYDPNTCKIVDVNFGFALGRP